MMRHPHMRSVREQAIGTLMWSVFLAACNPGDIVVRDPSKGGLHNQPGNCVVGPASSAWTNARLSGTQVLPEKCPYNVTTVNERIPLSVDLFGPKSTTYASGFGTLWPVVSTLGDNFVAASSQSVYWQDDMNDPDGRILTFNVWYNAGHYPVGGPGPWSQDSGKVTVDFAVFGVAEAFFRTSGSANVTPGYLMAPAAPVAGNATTFRAITGVDTNAYNFSWRVDGTSRSNNDADLVTQFATAGSHQVVVYATNASDKVDTMPATVLVRVNVSFTGSESMKSGGTTTFSAVLSGGTSPYTYVWKLNGATVSTSSTYRYTFRNSAQLALSVKDARGNTGSNSATLVMIDPNC
jgi:hypothetical protein